jgi:hypothetical protein
MEWTKLKLGTFIPELPKVITKNFQIFNDYIDSFYDSENHFISKPVITTGRVKGTTGEFINLLCDNLIIRDREASTGGGQIETDNLEYVDKYNGSDESLGTKDPSINWTPNNPAALGWLDTSLDKKYYKINNTKPIGINGIEVGQEIYLMYNRSIDSGSDYEIILDPNDPITNLQRILYFEPQFGPISYHKLVCVKKTEEFGCVWAAKEWGGAFGSKLVNY